MKKKQHILIAEDEAVNRMLLRKILEEEYVVSEVSDGAGVLRALKESGDSFTAVVLDLIMPGMDGFEVLKKISEMPEFSNIPILVATGGSSPDSEAQSLAAGAWDYVTKPYNPVVLRYRLRNIIARSQMPLLERVRVLAQQDQLTGLYNRRYFMKQTEKMLKANADVRFVLIRLDVDRFRLYNASFGSRAGDDLLRKIAETLRATVGTYPLCTYGRIESDIFCVCMPYQEQKLMEDIRRATAFSHTLSKDYRLELSFGLYVISGPEVEMENAYSRAVIAAAKCKDNFNRSYAFYDAAMEEAERKNQQIINEMERALREKQFHVYLQPKYSMKTGCPCGAEALVRWEHPQRGMVMPGSFIPLFERNGFILQLDYYMWENVCALLKQWIQEGKSPMPVSVNVSRVSLFSPDVVERLTGLVRKYEIPVELLNLEITESAYMANPAFMKKVIQELHDRGFVILMDDFGSGYSSLNTLKNIDVDILKIDLRFLSIGERNARSEKILASVVRMAGWIGTPVVVEGVETKEQRDFLESIGCVFVQGYFYAKPMPVPDYVSLMERTALPENLGKDTLREEDFPNALWSSDARVSELLREVSAPFVLYEYSDGQVDVLRMNEEYLRIFSNEETSRMLSDRELAKLREAMDRCVAGGDSAECDCMFLIQNGVSRWFQIRLHYIATTGKVSLLSGTFKDISMEKRLEFSMVRLFNRMDGTGEHTRKILVVDDSAVSREILGKLFENRYEVLYAADGAEGMQILQKNAEDISLILLDMIMPVMDGRQFLHAKGELPACTDIPVIIISVQDDESIQTDMLNYGISDYITKPYVPEVVLKRVENVLDYRNRFSEAVREYNGQLLISESQDRLRGEQTAYTPGEIKELLKLLAGVFDIVRIVDPRETATLLFQEDGSIQRVPYTCYRIWKRDEHCENCASLCALHQNSAEAKMETLDDELYYVVSRPLTIAEKPGTEERCVLEIVNRISHSVLLKQPDQRPVRTLLEETRRKMYTDELTGVYNRRYIHEMLFSAKEQGGAVSLGVILSDVTRFKDINDTWGHRVGDVVLQEIAAVLRAQVRDTDAVIRYGGDEFLIILTGCAESQTAQAVSRLSAAVCALQSKVLPEQLHMDFGYAYAGTLESEEQFLQMVETADARMYQTKRERARHKTDAREKPQGRDEHAEN